MQKPPSPAPAHRKPAKDPHILKGLQEIAAGYDVILSDIWGVVHDGRHHFTAAADALMRFRAQGGKVVLITNAPRPRGPIIAQLDEFRVPHEAYDNIVTSGDATIALIAKHGSQAIHHIGPDRDLALFEEATEITGLSPALTGIEAADYVVCTGLFDDDHETPDDYDATLHAMLKRNLPMICANPDIVVHRGDTLLYCSGALAQRYAAMGGQVQLAGKPYAPIYEMALNLAGKPGARVLAIGDAMATDMLGAHQQGIDGLFVSHGIHREALHGAGEIMLDAAVLDIFLMEQGDIQPRYAINMLRW